MSADVSHFALPILLVEDDYGDRGIICEILHTKQIHVAETIQDGLRLYKQYQPAITFLDIQLPDGTGHQLLEQIHSINKDAYVVMLTSSRSQGDVHEAMERGAAGYIVKPCSPHQIHSFIEKYQAKYGALTPSLVPQQTAFSHEVITTTLRDWRVLLVNADLKKKPDIQEKLQELGCIVEIAGDSHEALDKFKTTAFQLLFIDTHIPENGGYQLAKDIRSYATTHGHLHPFLIAVVNNAEEAGKKEWAAAEMDDFIVKPFSLLTLKAMLHKYVEHWMQQQGL